MKAYTQEMRIKKEPCPYCGFWHSAASHPPQFSAYVFEIERLEAERKEIYDALQKLKLGDMSFLNFALIVGNLIDPVKITETDLEWATEKAKELGLL